MFDRRTQHFVVAFDNIIASNVFMYVYSFRIFRLNCVELLNAFDTNHPGSDYLSWEQQFTQIRNQVSLLITIFSWSESVDNYMSNRSNRNKFSFINCVQWPTTAMKPLKQYCNTFSLSCFSYIYKYDASIKTNQLYG